ncbi:hypothetical protein [Schaalia hyovaginalis]|uniref:Uncharacterized protein n=1 Tax=Schaalia hyovaginalis TaxID=29316 RepID=A0A923IYK3_9ACTO|nr:hypothetical protein [Schaalia hyovaginalis]MBB6333724.1 hypothetical protein [Schaalia hyovaginalis]MDY2667910.1 hypothetical protein [Schaalia hyovaginalis]
MTTTPTRHFRGAFLGLDAPDSTLLIESAAGAPIDEGTIHGASDSFRLLQPFGSSIDLALALPQTDTETGWTDTLVVTVEDLPADLSEEDWQAALTTRTTQEIPGFQIIDIARWDGLSDATLVRTGLFILDERSLTTLQWTWTIPHPYTPETRLGLSATFTCPTRDFENRYEGFIGILNTVEVI